MKIDKNKVGEFRPPPPADNSDRDFLVKYKNEAFDLKEFLHKHPGGIGTLGALKNCDLTKVLDAASTHSEAALYLMKEYKVQLDCNNNYECNGSSVSSSLLPEKDPKEVVEMRKVSNGNGYATASSRNNSNGHLRYEQQDVVVSSTGNGLRVDKDYLFRDNDNNRGATAAAPTDERLEVI